MKTRISKGRDGFEARTEIELENNRVLVIRTGKTSGGLTNSSSVWTKTPTGHLQTVMFSDYSQRKVYMGVRCTEKTVTDLHAQALAELPLILESVCDFYAEKDERSSIAPATAADIAKQFLAGVPALPEFQGVC